MTYNGHKNYHYWNVALWIGNDESLYRLALDCLKRSKTRTQAACIMLDELNQMGITKTDDGAVYTMTTIRAAMDGLS